MEADISTQAVGLASSADFSLLSLFIRADIIVKSVIVKSVIVKSVIVESTHSTPIKASITPQATVSATRTTPTTTTLAVEGGCSIRSFVWS